MHTYIYLCFYYFQTNGAIVCTVDELADVKANRESFMPKYLLGEVNTIYMNPWNMV